MAARAGGGLGAWHRRVGLDCPLTPIEKALRRRDGQAAYEGGFVDKYVEGVIYPESYTPLLRAVTAVLIIVGWARALIRLRRMDDRPPTRCRGRSGPAARAS